MKWFDEKWFDGIIKGLLFAVYAVLFGIVWCFDKVCVLFGKESMFDR